MASEKCQHILTFSGRELALEEAPRTLVYIFTQRRKRLLRCELISSGRKLGASTNSTDTRLELGNHPMAQDILGLDLGRMIGYQWAPQYQAILTPVIETMPV
jgi:hypothetical protein